MTFAYAMLRMPYANICALCETTAGIGSDHVDLVAAAKAGLTVAEVTGSNTVSVAEHVVMMILSLVPSSGSTTHQVVVSHHMHGLGSLS